MILVTGSAGHLGEALVHTLRERGEAVTGLDVLPSPTTDVQASVADAVAVAAAMRGVQVVLHTATLHKPHVATHAKHAFVETNVSGTLCLLEAAVAAGVRAFVFTSTTSAFGAALTPAAGEPAAWIDESVTPVPRNIYGVTKTAAEDLCQLVHREHGLPCLVLRTSRFFPEEDDNAAVAARYALDNVQVNELLYRRVDTQDVVDAHLLAIERARDIGFAKYIISATTPFRPEHRAALRVRAPEVLRDLVPQHQAVYAARGWAMFDGIDRIYVNDKARRELGWAPRHDFAQAIGCLARGEDFRSALARRIGVKGYHRSA